MTTDVKEDVNELIKKLEVVSVFRQLPACFQGNNDIEITQREINSLAGYASILSLSDDSDDMSLSYEIITRLIEYTAGDCERVISVADVVFSRIGNFPGRTLLRKRHLNESGGAIPPPLKLECISREAENTVYIEETNTLLTDFQYKFFDSLEDEHALSVSAPTSAGKSFVLNLDLIRRIKSEPGQSVVYVVPTRALISEVSNRIRVTLRAQGLDEVIVRTAPFPVAKNKIKQAVVYVFTQERLMSFINSQDGEPYISSLIIDEAHEIQNGKRGIVLQNAIDIALSRFSAVKILFASPLIKNPSYLLSLFGRTSNGRFFVETLSPVSQNLILVSEVRNKPLELDLSLLSRGFVVPVGQVITAFRFRDGKAKQRANFCLAISSEDESVISFSNGPADAETVACHIADLIENFQPSEEVLTFANFIRREIHPEYPLASCIERGVAFHYGKMPSLVRSGVERLFKEGKIKIICCTSTLLQGVNLPAKHIIIENPMSGDIPMTRADFMNLAGRAGRLLHEFHGNIWCIRPNEWNSDCYTGDKLQEISSAISRVMENGGLAVQEILSGSPDPQVNKDEAEAAFGKLYHDYLVDPELGFIESYRSESNSEALDETLVAIKNIDISLPLELLENNQSLRPDHLQGLYECLKKDFSLKDTSPLSPYEEGAKERMVEIFRLVAISFEWDVTDKYMLWIGSLAYKWVWGVPLGKILSDRVSYLRSNGSSDSVSSMIRGCLGVLENAIRFKLVKYFSAYLDILRYVAEENCLDDKIDDIEPYHIYLEFGSFNRDVLNLMALGISRFTALHLEGKFDLPSDVEAEEYLDSLSKMNLNAINMSAICRKEIEDLLGVG